MNNLNFDKMNRDELAHFIVANRDTLEGKEALKTYISRMMKKAKNMGIDLAKLENQQEIVN
jgi:hypothetical protein